MTLRSIFGRSAKLLITELVDAIPENERQEYKEARHGQQTQAQWVNASDYCKEDRAMWQKMRDFEEWTEGDGVLETVNGSMFWQEMSDITFTETMLAKLCDIEIEEVAYVDPFAPADY